MMRNCANSRRNGRREGRTDPEEALAKIQAAVEEMTMKRYVHSISPQPGQRQEDEVLCRLDWLRWVLNDQNRLLAEILETLKGMARQAPGV